MTIFTSEKNVGSTYFAATRWCPYLAALLATLYLVQASTEAEHLSTASAAEEAASSFESSRRGEKVWKRRTQRREAERCRADLSPSRGEAVWKASDGEKRDDK